MDCSEDLVCQLFDWFSSSGYVIRETFHLLDSYWDAAGGILSQHGEKIVAAASFSFGAWRWWIYREHVLHKRLEEYIRESDRRLEPTATRMMEAILRPGRAVALSQPAYAVELNRVLESNSWRQFFGVTPLENQTARQVRRAIDGIRQRQRTISDAGRSLQRQRAEAHMLMGGLAAAKARRTTDRIKAGRYDGRALREFQRTLQIETHHRDAEAKECEAFQFLRLGQLDLATAAYEAVADFARGIDDPKKRDLIIARSKRYRAQIMQIEAVGGSMLALALIGAGANPTSTAVLPLRSMYAPYQWWDAIEQAEIHYVAAYIGWRLNKKLIEAGQLSSAEYLYRDVLSKLPKRLIFVRAASRALRAEAQAGLDRVTLARTGKYDSNWLMSD